MCLLSPLYLISIFYFYIFEDLVFFIPNFSHMFSPSPREKRQRRQLVRGSSSKFINQFLFRPRIFHFLSKYLNSISLSGPFKSTCSIFSKKSRLPFFTILCSHNNSCPYNFSPYVFKYLVLISVFRAAVCFSPSTLHSFPVFVYLVNLTSVDPWLSTCQKCQLIYHSSPPPSPRVVSVITNPRNYALLGTYYT